MENLHYLKDLTSTEVFDQWREDESKNEGWQNVAREQGWENWEQWRSYMAETLFKFSQREWKLYAIKEPEKQLSKFLVGPFPSWQQKVPPAKVNKITFEEYYNLDRQRWNTHERIQDILNNWPPTRIIGLRQPHSSKIVCIEGTHRCMAATIAKIQGRQLSNNPQVNIALASIRSDEKDLLFNALKTGGKNPQRT